MPDTLTRSLQLATVAAITNKNARRKAILALCREWHVEPIEIRFTLGNGMVKARYDYTATLRLLAQKAIEE